MENGCPISRAYLAAVRRLVDFRTIINESYVPHLEELEDLAAQAGAARERQHQRAFLCIEVMLTRLVQHIHVGESQAVASLTWDRSRAGLNEVVRVLHDDHDNLLGSIVEYNYSRGLGVGKGVDQILYANKHRLVEVYTLARESAVILRQSLKNPEVTLMRVGRRLAQAHHLAKMDVFNMFMTCYDLLDQTENWAPRAWELQKRSKSPSQG